MVAAISVAAQLFYGGGTIMLLAVSSVCALLLSFLVLVPIRYDFEDDALILVNPMPFKNKRIPYSDMLYYDAVGSFFALKLDFDATEVFLTYKSSESAFKKTFSCHPENIKDFVAELQKHCPEAE